MVMSENSSEISNYQNAVKYIELIKQYGLLIAIILICFLNVLISLYIKYYVDFYRLYMYSIYPETMACYMIYCGKKSYCHINEHK